MEMVRALWRFRYFILERTKHELKAQFARSGIGYFWLVLTPAALVATYFLVFATVLKAKLPGVDNTLAYGIYLCAGIVFWTSFLGTLTRLTSVFVSEKTLLRERYVPSSILPMCVLASETVHLAVYLLVFFAFLIVSGSFPGLVVIHVIPLIIVQYAFVLGIGLVFAVMNVFIRDVGQSLGILLHFWFWLTPIVYPIEILPLWARGPVERFNPLVPLMQGYQGVFVAGSVPDYLALLPTAILALLFLALALYLFRRTVGSLSDLV